MRTQLRRLPTGNRDAVRLPAVRRARKHGRMVPRDDNRSAESSQGAADKDIEYMLEEARMVLPGLQALFGFQLIVVFSQRFVEALDNTARQIHLAALVLVAVSIALLMAPAAYHRQVQRDRSSRFFIRYTSSLITVGMVPLLIALSVEVGIVAMAITTNLRISAALCLGLAVLLTSAWYLFPWWRRSGGARRHRRTP